jgi:hypothetical protein
VTRAYPFRYRYTARLGPTGWRAVRLHRDPSLHVSSQFTCRHSCVHFGIQFKLQQLQSPSWRGEARSRGVFTFLTAADASVGTVLADDQEKTRTPLRTGGSGTEGTDTHNREQAHSIQTELDPGWTCGVPPLRLRHVASRTDKTCIEVVPVGSLLLPYCTLKTCGLLPSDPIATCPAPR